MAKFNFIWDRYDIKETRARHEDTNYISLAISVNGQPVGSPQIKSMGNQNNGTYSVGLSFSDVEVPDGATVVMLYQILNSGHKNPAEVEKILSSVAQTELKKSDDSNSSGAGTADASSSGDDWKTALLKAALQYSIQLAFADCDGPITPPGGRRIVWNSSELKGVAPGTKYEDSQDEPGSDSARGCGSNSHYIVHYTVAAPAAAVFVAHSTSAQVHDHRR